MAVCFFVLDACFVEEFCMRGGGRGRVGHFCGAGEGRVAYGILNGRNARVQITVECYIPVVGHSAKKEMGSKGWR